jgi:hypothetical protein
VLQHLLSSLRDPVLVESAITHSETPVLPLCDMLGVHVPHVPSPLISEDLRDVLGVSCDGCLGLDPYVFMLMKVHCE